MHLLNLGLLYGVNGSCLTFSCKYANIRWECFSCQKFGTCSKIELIRGWQFSKKPTCLEPLTRRLCKSDSMKPTRTSKRFAKQLASSAASCHLRWSLSLATIAGFTHCAYQHVNVQYDRMFSALTKVLAEWGGQKGWRNPHDREGV